MRSALYGVAENVRESSTKKSRGEAHDKIIHVVIKLSEQSYPLLQYMSYGVTIEVTHD